MKAIINEKLYDTTTSEVLLAQGTLVLYKTQNGTYYMVNADGIIPMTIEDAKKYLGVHDTDAYIKEFGEVELA